MKILGIDIGGTFIKFGLVKDGEIIENGKIKTPVGEKGLILAIVDIVKRFGDIDGLGIGIPGMVDENGVVRNPPNLKGINELELRKILLEKLKMEVKVENDANLYAIGEWLYGAGKGFENVIVITLGTGVGTGFILNGKVLRGSMGTGGEGGHMVISIDGPPCNCGSRGCLESFIGEVHFSKRARHFLLSKGLEVPEGFNLKMLYEMAKEKKEEALKLWEEYGFYLGIGILNFLNITGAEAVIIGGGISRAFEFFKGTVERVLKEKLMAYELRNIKIKRAELADKAGILGAYGLFEKER